MQNTYYWNPGTLLFALGNQALRAYQPHYRRNILVDNAALGWIDTLVSEGEAGVSGAELVAKWNEKDWGIKDATIFALYDHAYANSAMYDEDARITTDDRLKGEDLLELLLDAGMIGDSWPIKYDHQKRHFADQSRGSFYEQIGTACLLNRREPTEWWTDQKFEDDYMNTRPTAYHFIQDKYLEKYLNEKMPSKSAIEVGCGTGYYTNRVAQYADKTVGVDYNPDYIEIARKRWSNIGDKDAEFGLLDIVDFSTDNQALIEEQYDFVIMIDTFLFLFHESYQPTLYENRQKVVANLRKLVKPNGKIILMDPHPLFLTPFFGDPNRPFGILESYNTRYFRIAPTLPELTEVFEPAGLAISRILEPRPDPTFADVSPVANKFYGEIPPWHLLELTPV